MANQTLMFEIGTEELPAFALHAATEKLGGMFADALDGAGIPHGEISVYSTPRRLIVSALAVPEATEALTETFRGPAAKIAFDADGNPRRLPWASLAARALTQALLSAATRTASSMSTP